MRKWPSVVIASALLAIGAPAQDAANLLEQGFRTPPDSAKPRTWWHWTGSNITKTGVTKDLEWMKRVGVGGMQLADVSAGGGQTVERKIPFGSPEWLDAVRHAASEAGRLSLEMTIFSSAGWSETGGPWVKPEQAMKKLVWSETHVEGPRTLHDRLAQPPSNNGPIRNLSTRRPNAPPDPTYYADSVTLAYRTPSEEAAGPRPKITTSAAAGDAAALADDDLNTALTLAGADPAWIEFEYAQPFKARAITIAARGGIPAGRVLASSDGAAFQTVATLPGAQLYRGGQVRTFAFPETTARVYRIEITGAAMNPASVMSQAAPPPAKQYEITEAALHSGARVHRWEEKAGFSFLFEYETTPTPAVPPAAAIPRQEVIDLTSRLTKDGVLDWDVPAGRWTILRMGYSLTGAKNRPAVPSGLGYEVDKLSRKHAEAYLKGYLEPIAASLGPLYGKALRYVLLDSWEAGMQNWTDDMPAEFRARRGYDPTPYLPALAGRVVESAETSDRFLWDFRRTLADMVADNHYGAIAGMLRSRGLGTYGEAAGVSLEIPEDTLLNKSKIDIPMGEFWVHDLHPSSMYYEDVRGAASAAHVYGKQIVAAESFTGGGYESPYTLKKIGDYWFAQGVNRIVFHTSAHQPLDTKPGNTMVGAHIHRNITWAEQAAPFMTYLARTSFLLQQGRSVADIAYLLNEGAPSTMPFWGAGLQPAMPDGYDYDYVNTDVLLNRMSADSDGRLTLPDGASYRVLVLPQTNRMTPRVARKLRELIAAGATVVGPKPVRSPSLSGQPEADTAVQAIAADVWGDLDGVSRTRRAYGKGTIVWGQPLEAVVGVPRDFESSRALDATVPWIHRRTPQADIYFVVNRSDRAQSIEARFRVSGKQAEIWRPDTGAMEPAEYTAAGERTDVALHLAERESVFVVFRRDAAPQPPPARRTTSTTLATIAGPWDVTFPPGLGAPARAQFVKLEPWTLNPDEGVKYFSGTATYTRAFDAPRAWCRAGAKLTLDLGAVRDIAEVSIDGRALGVLWKPPYRLDATGAVRPGANLLQVKVTNQWTNRLAGDRAAPPDRRILAAAPGSGGFGPPPQPVESGLLGPVSVVMVEP
jgi:hypothetical protein